MRAAVVLIAVLTLLLASVVPREASAGQGAGTVASEDSTSLHLLARRAVDRYESAAFRYSAPSMKPPGGLAYFGGVCEAQEGAARCLMGRDVVCPLWSKVRGFGHGVQCWTANGLHARDSARIYAERDSLLEVLDLVGRQILGDRWVSGQRVYFLSDALRHARAIDAAAECRSVGAWCQLLSGFALQRAGRTAEADRAIHAALSASSANERCALTDLTLLLDSAATGAYANLPCDSAQRLAFEEGVWWLADPSWLVPGNDRRTEHIARGVDLLIQQEWRGYLDVRPDALFPLYSTSAEQLIVRGRSDSYWIENHGFVGEGRNRRQHCAPGDGFSKNPYPHPNSRWVNLGLGGSWVGENENTYLTHCARTASASDRFHFFPDARAMTSALSAPAESWDLFAGPPPGIAGIDPPYQYGRPHGLPPERYTPPYADLVRSLDERQIGYLRRGDSALVVAAFDLGRDSLFALLLEADAPHPQFTAGIIAYDSVPATGAATDPVMHAGRWTLAPRWTTTFAAPWDSLLIGAELLLARDSTTDPTDPARRKGILARTRLGIAPPPRAGDNRIGLSDVFFIEPGEGVGQDRSITLVGPDGVLPRILGTTDLRGRESVGLFWELYGVQPRERLSITLAISELKRERGLFGRIFGRLVGGNGKASTLLKWEEEAPANVAPEALATAWTRTLTLSLGSLPPGTYEAMLTCTFGDGGFFEVSRTFRIGERDGS